MLGARPKPLNLSLPPSLPSTSPQAPLPRERVRAWAQGRLSAYARSWPKAERQFPGDWYRKPTFDRRESIGSGRRT
jgi:hypothetical protein